MSFRSKLLYLAIFVGIATIIGAILVFYSGMLKKDLLDPTDGKAKAVGYTIVKEYERRPPFYYT
jgi:hypothetical protein